MKPTCAIIQFPGSNCEYETRDAAQFYGFDAKIIRWNEDPEIVRKADAYILPGGFSYQDRVRAGAISATLPILGVIEEAAAEGKPILGICNGCQILAETGLVPNLGGDNTIEMALAPNRQNDEPVGFICDWVFVKVSLPKRSLFTRYMKDGDAFPIPVNHGEGRFILGEDAKTVVEKMTHFSYTDAPGVGSYQDGNPNGSADNLAGLCNREGNVLAMMPHPERGAFLRQVPDWIPSDWAEKKRAYRQGTDIEPGPWGNLFRAMRDAILERQKVGLQKELT